MYRGHGHLKQDVRQCILDQWWPSTSLLPTPPKILRNTTSSWEELTKVVQEGRREGARRFYIAGDFNNEWGLLRTGMDDDEEVQETMVARV